LFLLRIRSLFSAGRGYNRREKDTAMKSLIWQYGGAHQPLNYRAFLPYLLVLSLAIGLFIFCERAGVIDPSAPDLASRVIISELSSSVSSIGIGGESAVITVKLINGAGKPYIGGIVHFKALLGTITPTDTTGLDGLASAIYKSGSITGDDTVSVTVNNYSQLVQKREVYLTVITRTIITLTAAKATLLADGQETTELYVTCKDGAGKPLSDRPISLFSEFGSVTPSITTDLLGHATAVYTAPSLSSDSSARIIAIPGSSIQQKSVAPSTTISQNRITHLSKGAQPYAMNGDTININLIGIRLIICASPDTINATGIDESTVTARLTTSHGNPLIGRTLTFSANFGVLNVSSANTDGSGQASVKLLSSTSSGVSQVMVSLNQHLSTSMYVHFIYPAPGNQISIETVTSSVTTLGIGGELALIAVKLVDGTGKPYTGGAVQFKSLLGSVTSVDTSDEMGYVCVEYRSGTTVGTDTVKITVVKDSHIVAQSELYLVLFSKALLTVTAENTALIADGQQAIKIHVLCRDSYGEPVSGKSIALFAEYGTVTSSVTTDLMGRAEADYTVPTLTADVPSRIIAYSQNIIPQVRDTVIVSLTGVRLTINASPDTISANGTAQTFIIARLTTTLNIPLISRTISFATNFGVLNAGSAITDGNGRASVQLRSAAATGVATVTASLDQYLSSRTYVHFVTSMPELVQLTISANPAEVSADGTSSTIITAVVKNANNNPIQNAEVLFSSTLGRVTAKSVTNTLGIATAQLYSERRNGVAVITASYAGAQKNTQVGFVGTQLLITAEPSALVANNTSKSAITITLRDAVGVPIESEPIELRTNCGTFSNGLTTITGVTSVTGTFVDSLKSNVQQMATVSAVGGGTQASTIISFTRMIISLAADTNRVVANDSVRLTFTITDIDGVPQPGVPVIFFTTLGELTPVDAITGGNGKAYTYLKSSIGGTATVTAQVTGGLITPSPPTAVITITSAPPAAIRLIVDPIVITVNSGSANLTAIATDNNNNPVQGQIVSFKIVQGPGGGESITPPYITSDATGSARAVFRAGSIGSTSVNSIIIRASIQEYSLSAEARLTIAGEPNRIKTSSSPPPSDNKDGTFSLPIGSIVSDINGNPVLDGTLVYYSTLPPIGVIKSPIQTSGGKASTLLAYPVDAAGEPICIISSSGNICDTLSIAQLPTAGVAGFVDSIRFIGASSRSILADGQSETQVSVIVIDPTKSPVAGVIVDFKALPGNSGSGLTAVQTQADGSQNPNWGIASFTVRSVSSKVDIYPTIEVTAGGKIFHFQENEIPDPSNPFYYRGIALDLSTDSDTIKVGETANLRVVLKETTSSVALANRQISFGASLGLITNQGQTDSRGELIIPFEAKQDSGRAKIIATFGANISDSVFIYITKENPAPPANIYLTADTSFIKVSGAEGRNTARIIARLTDANNNPVGRSIPVQLTTSLGTFTATGTNTVVLLTDLNGMVTASLASSITVGTAVITAVSGGITVSQTLVTFQAGSPNTIIISADTVGSALSGYLAQIRVSGVITDSNGNPVAHGTLVRFTVESDGSGDNPIVTIVGIGSTNEYGIATSTLTYAQGEIGKGLRIRITAGTTAAYKDIKLPRI